MLSPIYRTQHCKSFQSTRAGAAVADLEAAVEALAAGLVIAIPTDTLYGLACDPLIPGATHRLFAAKRRPHDIELPLLIADLSQARPLAHSLPSRLVERYWPGALTIVVKRSLAFAEPELGGDHATVGLRVPEHDLVRDLCGRVGPVAVSSANHHGEQTPTDAAGVRGLFTEEEVAVVVDGGICHGEPSTVVDCTTSDLVLLREGRIPFAEIEKIWAE